MITGDGLLIVGTLDGVVALETGGLGSARTPWPLERGNPRNTANHSDGDFPPSCEILADREVYTTHETLRLRGKAYGPGLHQYHWYRDDEVLSDKVSPELVVEDIQTSDRGCIGSW